MDLHRATVVTVNNRHIEMGATGLVPDVEFVSVADVDELDAKIAAGLRADVMFVTGSDEPTLARADALGVRWVHIGATGVEGISSVLGTGRLVTCSRGASGVPIAEFVLASMLAFEKNFPDVWISQPPAQWGRARHGELATKTVGLIGLGGIGTAVAKRALAFDMHVLAVRRTDAPAPFDGIQLVTSLHELLGAADHVVVAAPATVETNRLLDQQALQVIKSGAHIINVARGSLIDHDALRLALDDGRAGLASLDVADPEPLPAGHWLYSHPRVHLSAHVSWSSPHGARRIRAAFTENLRRYITGEPLSGIVDTTRGY